MKYTEGATLTIIAEENGHYFEIGEVVKVVEVGFEDYYVENAQGDGWYVTDEEVILST